jgi:ligand-binding sensor domain-containing protein
LLTEPDQEFILYNDDNSGLGENEIRSMAEDRDGNIWVATWGGGVSKVHLSPSGVHSTQLYNPSLKIIPNPAKANEELVIYHDSSQDLVSMSIWSTAGILLKYFEMGNSTGQNTFVVSGMPRGCFIAVAKDSQGKKFTSRFVLTK